MLILYDDHDVSLLDLMRARKLNNKPWPKEQLDSMLQKFDTYIHSLETKLGAKVIYLNSLNFVYSKSKDKFFLANLQNILIPKEYKKIKKLEEEGTVFQELPNDYFRAIFPHLENLYVNEETKLYSQIDNHFSLSILSLQVLEISYSDNPATSKEFSKFLMNKLASKAKLKPLLEGQAMRSINHSLATKLRKSLVDGSKDLGGGGVNIFKTSSNKEPHLPAISIDSGKKMVSEIKIINRWKQVLRKLNPEHKFKKDYFQASFLLLIGNLNKAISYCRSSIQEFTQIEKLDIMDWIDLITLLINCLLKGGLHDQAVYYAKNLVAYVKKAHRSNLMSPVMAGALIISLESLHTHNKKELLNKAKLLRLPSHVMSSLSLYLRSAQFFDSIPPSFEVPGSSEIGFMADREKNHQIVKYLFNLNTLKVLQELKEYEDVVDTLKNVGKRTGYLNNLAIIQYMMNNKYEAFKRVQELKQILPAESFKNEKKQQKASQAQNDEQHKMQNYTENLINQGVFNFLASPSGDLEKPIKCLEEAKRLVKKSGSSHHKNELTVYNNLAVFHFLNKDYEKSNETIIEMYSKIKEKRQKKPIYLVNLAIILSKSGQHQKAKSIIDKIKRLIQSGSGLSGQPDGLSSDFLDLEFRKKLFLTSSVNNVRLVDFDAALEDLERFEGLLPGTDQDPVGHVRLNRMKAMVYIKMGRLDKAEKLLDL